MVKHVLNNATAGEAQIVAMDIADARSLGRLGAR
jgi:hypothetical protein